MTTLIIVESPGKIKKISEILGDGYVVMASVGHIIDLDEKKMSIDLETFEPEYKQYDNKKEVITKLRTQSKKCERILLASDEDREGEMIAWSLARELKIKVPERIVFNSITKKEIENSVRNPKGIDNNMVYAQQARRILDRLAGYMISPVLIKTVRNVGAPAKSAGRVQSVVVKLIVEKEKEIRKFYDDKKSSYYMILANMKIGKYKVNTKLYNKNSENTEKKTKKNKEIKEEIKEEEVEEEGEVEMKGVVRFDKKEEERVIEIIENMGECEYKILQVISKIRKQYPGAPYTTSTLQQDASRRYNMDSKRCMSVAQKLYEGGHITYMRTDSTSISGEAMEVIKGEIEKKYGENYYERREFRNKKQNTQEAHECVRPTKIYNNFIEGTEDEKKLYNMIWKRTIMSQMKPAEYDNITVEIEMLKRKILSVYKLVGSMETLKFEGYMIVDNKSKNDEKIDIEEIRKKKIEYEEIEGKEDVYKPPMRYNNASLINKMDPKNLNIGRPSTYAAIIDKIISRNYVEIKDIEGNKMTLNRYIKRGKEEIKKEEKSVMIGGETKKIVPTELGERTVEFLEKYFEKIMDYKFTAKMEEDLDEVAEGKEDKLKVIKPFYEYIKERMDNIPAEEYEYEKPETVNIGKINNHVVKIKEGRFGKYVVCDIYKLSYKVLKVEEGESNDSIYEKVKNKIEEMGQQKTWKIDKMKYILKKGAYGYFVEEWNNTTKKKVGNISIKYLIGEMGKEMNKEKEEEIVEDITEERLKIFLENFKNYKKNTKKNFKNRFVKKNNNNQNNEEKKENKEEKKENKEEKINYNENNGNGEKKEKVKRVYNKKK